MLQSAILTASRAVSPKSTIPALEGLLLEAEENGTVFLTGYNQETGIRSAIQADVSQPGSMVLPARLFGEIVRKLPDDMVLFQEEALKVPSSPVDTASSTYSASTRRTSRSCPRWNTRTPWPSPNRPSGP
ncbi:MAG: hypothetical protein ACLUNZ_01835 [Evtepia sp.]